MKIEKWYLSKTSVKWELKFCCFSVGCTIKSIHWIIVKISYPMNIYVYIIHYNIPREPTCLRVGHTPATWLATTQVTVTGHLSSHEHIPHPRHIPGFTHITSLTLALPFSTREVTQQYAITTWFHLQKVQRQLFLHLRCWKLIKWFPLGQV